MSKSRQLHSLLVLALIIFLFWPSASTAQVKVIMSGGFSAAYQELLPEFQSGSGITVTTMRGASQGDGPNTIGAQLRRGVPADVVIMSRGGLAELLAEGRIVVGSDLDLAQVSLGVGVRAGAQRPDISTVNSFKETLLRARSVGSQSSTTIYLTTKLIPQLGIASAIAGKLSNAGPANLASGEVEMVIAPVSELLTVPGVDFVGAIPREIQFIQTFAAAVVKGTKEPDASKQLIAYLGSGKATPAIEHAGMKRPESAADQKDKDSNYIFPGKMWIRTSPEQLGWSISRLEGARKYFDTLPPANLVVVDHGRVVVEWGDPAMKIMVSSVRKSILSVLYGIDLPSGKLDLDTTIGQLNIDDEPPLTAEEKKATVRMLLESRSGVYHSFVAGTPTMLQAKPERGSHAPGSFFYYNNWDFNALGTIFEQQFHTSIGPEFQEKIALPTQMEDFRLEDMYYKSANADDPDYAKSLHRAYLFRLSARDLARFGYLMLRQGNWNGTRIVPSSWIEQSTHAYSENARAGAGYGYLWWVNGFGLSEKNFFALGALGKFVVVIPDRDLVVVLLNHTEFPSNGSTMPIEEYNKLPTVSDAAMGHLLSLLLAAAKAP